MSANFIAFVNELVYGDVGAAELGLPPGPQNHMQWTLDRLASPPAAPGTTFLEHHLDVMLERYASWRSTYELPPVRPWNGSDLFMEPMAPTVGGPPIPPNLSGGSFPAGWTTNALGLEVQTYYHALRNHTAAGYGGTELTDEIKAPYSHRYWAFMAWVSDLRRRLLGQPVFPVPVVYDADGTILSEREFLNYFHQVHHVWHPNVGEPGWTVPTPGFRTAVCQFRRKKHLSASQVGEEFFQFHRDHLEIFDRWMARTGQDRSPSLNTCGHDLSAQNPGAPPAGLDIQGGGRGLPLVDYSDPTPVPDFTPPHESNWEGTAPGFDGRLGEFPSAGIMGQYLATDNTPFATIPVPGAFAGDIGYHADGHVLNGDLWWPVANNFSHRFFGWHGFIDDVWARRAPAFVRLAPVQADGSAYPQPQILTIVRDLAAGSDTVEPALGIDAIDLATGTGSLRLAIDVRADPFGRPLVLTLDCEVLREAGGDAPVIGLPRRTITLRPPGAATAPGERNQTVEFVEEFHFDGSPGTVDAVGRGPFASDNLAMSPTPTGFVNSLVRVTAHLTCEQKPDGSVPAAPGTLSGAGTTITGSGTTFTTTFVEGDRIRALGQVRTVITVSSATSLTVDAPFLPALPAGTAYARLDGFDLVETVRLPLLQEKVAPDITIYLDRSSFSSEQVDAVAAGGTSEFADAFYVAVQDRSARPAPIVWPSDPKTDLVMPAFYGLIAPPVHAAGLHLDLAHAPEVELLDATTDTAIPGVDVVVTAAEPEDPSLHPSIPQRVTYRCKVVFTGNAMFAGMVAGDTRDMKLRVVATDRAGNQAVDDASRVRLQVNANPYMLDGDPSWLSIDTRVFRVTQGQTRFGVTLGADPKAFIAQVIDDLRAGGGTAGGESFDALPTDQPGSALEYATQVGGVAVFNFALARVRLESVTGATDVRASFRLLRWGTANVSFDDTLAYRTHPATGIALLGRTAADELASIPFFAEPRVAVGTPMTAQTDPKNLTSLPGGGGSQASFFGVHMDINESTPRFPVTFEGDGGFGAVAPADMRSIRDLMIGQHQCMVVELFYPPDPTVPGATPSTSDNLAQRNLLILQTANPGSPSTRMVQHSFDVDLRRARRAPGKRAPLPFIGMDGHEHGRPHAGGHAGGDGGDAHVPHDGDHEHAQGGASAHDSGHGHGHGHGAHDPNCATCGPRIVDDVSEPIADPLPARPPAPGHGHGLPAHGGHGGHAYHTFLGAHPELLARLDAQAAAERLEASRWEYDVDDWKRTDGLDELVFHWNNLPAESIVELYLPGAGVAEIVNYRNLRNAPGTVGIVDTHTLRLRVAGPTYLPVPPFWGENLAGLVTVTLPPGIKAGQRFVVDVTQVRADSRRVLGGFQLNVQVEKARGLVDAEKRMVGLFRTRLAGTPEGSRWRPILERQLRYFAARARGFADLAAEEEADVPAPPDDSYAPTAPA